jgi:hypothetical protein
VGNTWTAATVNDAGDTFKGWAASQTATTPDYTPGQTDCATITAGKTLYAVHTTSGGVSIGGDIVGELPVSYYAISGITSGNVAWSSGSISVAITEAGTTAGYGTLKFKIDNGTEQSGGDTINANTLETGSHTLTITAVHSTGTYSAVESFTVTNE